jgi:beta-lactamase superfamily II metal-dependent hydrolase
MSAMQIYAFNVGEGDCFLICHPSGRNTVIDVSMGNHGVSRKELSFEAVYKETIAEAKGNYGMCKKPTNPVEFMKGMGLKSIWRFILTHPDMDHMDGIENLFQIPVSYFWDCGLRREKPLFDQPAKYLETDYDYYSKLIAGQISGVTVIPPRAGSKAMCWNADDENGNGVGDSLHIVAPDDTLIAHATQSRDINDGCYVVVQDTEAGSIVFGGDSNDATWEYILDNHASLVKNVAVLFAPHHGRESNRDHSFLKHLNPKVTFFGCAGSQYLSYDAYNSRGLRHYTSNQCGNVLLMPHNGEIYILIENETFAKAENYGVAKELSGWWLLGRV